MRKLKSKKLQINHLAENVEQMQLNMQNSSKLNKHRENEIIELKKSEFKKMEDTEDSNICKCWSFYALSNVFNVLAKRLGIQHNVENHTIN